MKRLLLALLFIPFIGWAQEVTPTNLTDLSRYHDANKLLEKTDDNFAIGTDSTNAQRTNINENLAAIAVNAADIDTLEAPPHGAMSFQDSAYVLDITQNTFAVITNAGNDLWNVTDADDMTVAGDTITIVNPGDYIVIAALSFSGTASDVFEYAMFENGVIATVKMERSTSQTDIGNISLPFYIEDLVAGDDLSLRMTNSASNDDATLVAGSCIIWRLHE